jgi:hypothetical protein
LSGPGSVLARRKLRNTGEQDLEKAEFRARISGMEKTLARVTEDGIPADAELALSFALPQGTELGKGSLLTLAARELSYPRHDWTFEDQPTRIPAPRAGEPPAGRRAPARQVQPSAGTEAALRRG